MIQMFMIKKYLNCQSNLMGCIHSKQLQNYLLQYYTIQYKYITEVTKTDIM